MGRLRKKMSKKPLGKGAVIALIATAGTMLAAMVFVLGYNTKEVRYHGNTRLTATELSNEIFDGKLPDNSLIFKYFGSGDRSLPFASEYEVSLATPEIIDIYVKEKPLVGYVKGEDCVYYIDDTGCVADISDIAHGDMTCINGIDPGQLEVGDPLPVPDEAIESIVSYADTFTRCKIEAVSIDFDENYLASMMVKNVKIYCGGNKNVSEKMERIKNITPGLDDISGEIHMENFDGSSKNLYIQT